MCTRFWSWSWGKILKLKFGQYFAADVWLRFTKLNLGQYSEARFGQDFNFRFSRNAVDRWDFGVNALSRFWILNLIKICVRSCDMNSTLGSVVPLAMFYWIIGNKGILCKLSEISPSKLWVTRLLCLNFLVCFIWRQASRCGDLVTCHGYLAHTLTELD